MTTQRIEIKETEKIEIRQPQIPQVIQDAKLTELPRLLGGSDERVSEFKKYLELAEEKTVITLLEKLVNEKYLEFVTEYPSTQYTKAMTRLNTWRSSATEVFNLEESDADTIVKTMCIQFMLKMTSHKRRRSHELVNGASRQDSGQNVLNENKGLKKFLGIK